MVATSRVTGKKMSSSKAQLREIVRAGRVFLKAMERFAATFPDDDDDDDDSDYEEESATSRTKARGRSKTSRRKKKTATASTNDSDDSDQPSGRSKKKRKLAAASTQDDDDPEGARNRPYGNSTVQSAIPKSTTRQVVQFCSTSGDVIRTHKNAAWAARALCYDQDDADVKHIQPCIYKILAGKSVTPVLGKYYFRYADEAPEHSAIHALLQEGRQVRREAPVIQFDAETGEILDTYESAAAAAASLWEDCQESSQTGNDNNSNNNNTDPIKIRRAIANVMNGRVIKPVLGKYYFRYAHEEPEESAIHKALADPKPHRGVPIVQFSASTGEIVAHHHNIKSAARKLCQPDSSARTVKRMTSHIHSILNGKTVQPVKGKYYFRRAHEQPEESAIHKKLDGIRILPTVRSEDEEEDDNNENDADDDDDEYDIEEREQLAAYAARQQSSSNRQSNRGIPIIQFDAETGETIATFDSINMAARSVCEAPEDAKAVENMRNAIQSIIKGKGVQPVLGKYYFRHAHETIEQSAIHAKLDGIKIVPVNRDADDENGNEEEPQPASNSNNNNNNDKSNNHVDKKDKDADETSHDGDNDTPKPSSVIPVNRRGKRIDLSRPPPNDMPDDEDDEDASDNDDNDDDERLEDMLDPSKENDENSPQKNEQEQQIGAEDDDDDARLEQQVVHAMLQGKPIDPSHEEGDDSDSAVDL